MPKRPSLANPTIKVFSQAAERKGPCGVCFSAATCSKTFYVKISPLRRHPDGHQISDEEAQAALRDLCARWEKGPPVHQACAMQITDKLAGFDITNGSYGEAPEDILSLFVVGGTVNDEVEVAPMLHDPDVDSQLELHNVA